MPPQGLRPAPTGLKSGDPVRQTRIRHRPASPYVVQIMSPNCRQDDKPDGKLPPICHMWQTEKGRRRALS
jgi:hypothetical protein